MPSMRYSLRRLLVITAVCCVLACGAGAAMSWFRSIPDRMDQSYAVWMANDMIGRYTHEHDGQWPRCWDDLRAYFPGSIRIRQLSFNEFQTLVEIDFESKRVTAGVD